MPVCDERDACLTVSPVCGFPARDCTLAADTLLEREKSAPDR